MYNACLFRLVSGGSSIKEYCILGNKQQVLTKDSHGEVVLWDILHVSSDEEVG